MFCCNTGSNLVSCLCQNVGNLLVILMPMNGPYWNIVFIAQPVYTKWHHYSRTLLFSCYWLSSRIVNKNLCNQISVNLTQVALVTSWYADATSSNSKWSPYISVIYVEYDPCCRYVELRIVFTVFLSLMVKDVCFDIYLLCNMLYVLQSIMVLMVAQNTLELLIGLKALPVSTKVGTWNKNT